MIEMAEIVQSYTPARDAYLQSTTPESDLNKIVAETMSQAIALAETNGEAATSSYFSRLIQEIVLIARDFGHIYNHNHNPYNDHAYEPHHTRDKGGRDQDTFKRPGEIHTAPRDIDKDGPGDNILSPDETTSLAGIEAPRSPTAIDQGRAQVITPPSLDLTRSAQEAGNEIGNIGSPLEDTADSKATSRTPFPSRTSEAAKASINTANDEAIGPTRKNADSNELGSNKRRGTKRKRDFLEETNGEENAPKPKKAPFLHEVDSSFFHPGLDAAQLLKVRDDFHQAVSSLSDPERNKPLFSQRDAISLTNFFFSEVFCGAAKRFESLLLYCSKTSHKQSDPYAGTRANQLRERQTDLPYPLTQFLYTYEHAADTLNATRNKDFAALNAILQHINLRRQYDELNDDDISIKRWLESRGEKTSKGRGYASLAIMYLAKELGLERRQFQTKCHYATGVMNLAERFGMGVICVLPQSAMWRLNSWSLERLTYVYPILERVAPNFETMCSRLGKFLTQPLQKGVVIEINLSTDPVEEQRKMIEQQRVHPRIFEVVEHADKIIKEERKRLEKKEKKKVASGDGSIA